MVEGDISGVINLGYKPLIHYFYGASTTSLCAGGHVTQSPSGQVIPHHYRLSTVLEVNLKYVALEMTTTKWILAATSHSWFPWGEQFQYWQCCLFWGTATWQTLLLFFLCFVNLTKLIWFIQSINRCFCLMLSDTIVKWTAPAAATFPPIITTSFSGK